MPKIEIVGGVPFEERVEFYETILDTETDNEID